MANNQKNIASVVRETIEETVIGLGCSIWDIEFVREGAAYCLRVTIDKDGGVDINDCERVHRAIDPLLDTVDPIETAYNLEVSSPGLGRTVRTAEQTDKVMGDEVRLKLFSPDDAGRKMLCGKLAAFGENTVRIETDEGIKEIEIKSIAKLSLADDE